MLDAVLGDYAVIRARTTEELMDIAYLATRRIYPVGNSLGMITVSGGAGIIVSDVAEEVGLPMPPMPDMAQAAEGTGCPSLRRSTRWTAPRRP